MRNGDYDSLNQPQCFLCCEHALYMIVKHGLSMNSIQNQQKTIPYEGVSFVFQGYCRKGDENPMACLSLKADDISHGNDCDNEKYFFNQYSDLLDITKCSSFFFLHFNLQINAL